MPLRMPESIEVSGRFDDFRCHARSLPPLSMWPLYWTITSVRSSFCVGLSGEGLHVGQQARNQILRRLAAMARDGFQQARVDVFLAGHVERLGDAVAERDDEVAGAERDGFLVEGRVLEEAEHEAAGLEPARRLRATRAPAHCGPRS